MLRSKPMAKSKVPAEVGAYLAEIGPKGGKRLTPPPAGSADSRPSRPRRALQIAVCPGDRLPGLAPSC